MSEDKFVVIERESDEYPQKLRDIANAPRQLYCSGDISLLKRNSVSIVGSRKFTVYGKQMAILIGKAIGRTGIPVVSGLANGIDTFAHEGTLCEGGKAIAVLGTGIGNVYPAGNRLLYKKIAETGLVVSEYPPSFPGAGYSFPARNRIISALCDSLVVVEAGVRSGALITAGLAIEQGKNDYAVPGNINSQFSLGTNLLIRDGATPLIIVEDVLRDMGVDTVSSEEAEGPEQRYGQDENAVMECLKTRNGCNVNELAHELNKKPASVNAILTVLEIKGAIMTYGGKIHLAK